MGKFKKDYYNTVTKILLNKYKENNTSDDETFRHKTKKEISERDEKYTELLTHFIRITRARNVIKEIVKWIFLISIIFFAGKFIFLMDTLFKYIMQKATVDQMISSVPVLVSAIVGGVSVVISIPVVITKYLFSTKEDENITKIILHTQEHDISGRKWASEDKNSQDIVKEANNVDIFEDIRKKINK